MIKKCDGPSESNFHLIFIKEAPKEARGSILDIVTSSIARTESDRQQQPDVN